MAETRATQTFPRRDDAGRVRDLKELVVAAGLGTAVGFVALLAVEGVLALIGLSEFGSASGWFAAILPALLFFDDLRAWRGSGVRFLVALVGLAVALATGLLAAGLVAGTAPIDSVAGTAPIDSVAGTAPMVSGGVGALVAALVYAPVWFLGIRRLAPGGRDGSEGMR
jgi:hypothetical protein